MISYQVPIIPALGRLRQEYHRGFEAILGYRVRNHIVD